MDDLREIEARIVAHLRSRGGGGGAGAGAAAIPSDCDLRALGLVDSLGIVDFVLFVETTFGCRLPPACLGTAAMLSVGAVAREVLRQRAGREAAPAGAGRIVTIGHVGSCVIAEMLRIEPRPGGYRGFLALLRERAGESTQLRVVAHQRLRWDEAARGPNAPSVPGPVAALGGERRFDPSRLAGADAVLLDLVHESYLWTIRPLAADEAPPGLADPYVSADDPAARRWLNVSARVVEPIGLVELDEALDTAIAAIQTACAARIILVGGLWHRARTLFTTEYTGSSFDSSLRRYMLANAVTSPDAFYARLRCIDVVGRRVAERRGVAWLDAQQVLGAAGQAAHADPIHLNDLGWDLLGRAVIGELQAAGVIERGGAAAPPDAPPAAQPSFRSIGARAALAVKDLTDLPTRSHPLIDVCALRVSLLRPSHRLTRRLGEIAERIGTQCPPRAFLWGLGALADRLAAACGGDGVEAVVVEGPFLAAAAAERRSGDLVIAGIRDMELGLEWVRRQVGGAGGESALEIVDLGDVGAQFAPGAEGTAEARARAGLEVEFIRRVLLESGARRPVVIAGDVAPLRGLWRGEAPRRQPQFLDDPTHRPPRGAVVICVGRGAHALARSLRESAAPGVTVLEPELEWLEAGRGTLVVAAEGGSP